MNHLSQDHPSVWVGTTPPTDYPALSGDIETDVAVIGGGIVGLTTAVLLKRAGARAALIEAGRVAAGTSGYNTGKVTSLHSLVYAQLRKELGDESAKIYGDSNQAAIEWVAAFARDSRTECDLVRAPALTYTIDQSSMDDIEAEVTSSTQLGLPASFTDQTDLPFPILGAVRFENQVAFNPRKYCLGLANEIPGDGSHLFEMTRVTEVDDASPCLVMTERGIVRAGRVVIATQLPIVNDGEFFAKTHPSCSYGLAARIDAPLPEGLYLGVGAGGQSIRPYRTGDQDYLVVVGEDHWVGEEPDTRQRYAALEQWTRTHFPVTSIDYRWSAEDYMPADHVPYIGRMSSHTQRLFTATGLKKWGLSLGTVAGLILADAVMDQSNPWASVYDSTRLDLSNSAKRLFEGAVESAKHLIGDRIEAPDATSLDAFGPGEGGIAKIDGETVAVSRDAQGGIVAVSPDCTHLGCRLAWNTFESTWDCPCHGSRFDREGRVIHAPAVTDLEKKSV